MRLSGVVLLLTLVGCTSRDPTEDSNKGSDQARVVPAKQQQVVKPTQEAPSVRAANTASESPVPTMRNTTDPASLINTPVPTPKADASSAPPQASPELNPAASGSLGNEARQVVTNLERTHSALFGASARAPSPSDIESLQEQLQQILASLDRMDQTHDQVQLMKQSALKASVALNNAGARPESANDELAAAGRALIQLSQAAAGEGFAR